MNHRTTITAFIAVMLAMIASCAPLDPGAGDAEDVEDEEEALQKDIAQIALENLGGKACGTNSTGGKGYESSCYGNGGQPEYWCSDFAKWVWKTAGAKVDGLTAAAGSFYCYGQKNGTLSSTPKVGDAVVYNYQGNCWADHVALVTEVHPNGNIVTVSGNWGGQSGSQAHFSSTSSVKLNTPAYPGVVGAYSNTMGMKISGFISPSGLPQAQKPAPASPGAEGSRAFLYPNQQHFLHGDGAGNIRHHYWDGNQKKVNHGTWATGTTGEPVTLVYGKQQHVFARRADGSLGHWFWDPATGAKNDTWAPSANLAGDPAAIVIGEYQAVWAVDADKKLQHWW